MENNQENVNPDIEIIESGLVNSDQLYLQNKAEVDMQIATAKAYPRNLMKITQNVMAIVAMDKETAATCQYALARDGKTIKGPTVHLANLILQQYGNMRVDSKVVGIEDNFIRAEAVCWDIENNVAVKTQVLRRITTKAGKRYSEDMIVTTGNAACAIAMRNSVFKIIPTALTNKALKLAEKTITGDLSDKEKLNARKITIIAGFREAYGVTEKEVLAFLRKPSVDTLTVDDILILEGTIRSLEDNDTTVDQVFRPTDDKTAGNVANPNIRKEAEELTRDAVKLKVETIFKGMEENKRSNAAVASYRSWLMLTQDINNDKINKIYKAFQSETNSEFKTLTELMIGAPLEQIVNFAFKVLNL